MASFLPLFICNCHGSLQLSFEKGKGWRFPSWLACEGKGGGGGG